MLKFRKADINDLEEVLEIYSEARLKFANDKTYQWTDNYPNEDTYKQDLEENNVFVTILDNKIVGVLTILLKEELDYRVINGNWINDEKYITIHRIATKAGYRGNGIGSFMIEVAKKFALENNINNIRIDTHENNIDMKRLLNKMSFVKCGVIYLREKNNDPRDAFLLNIK